MNMRKEIGAGLYRREGVREGGREEGTEKRRGRGKKGKIDHKRWDNNVNNMCMANMYMYVLYMYNSILLSAPTTVLYIRLIPCTHTHPPWTLLSSD